MKALNTIRLAFNTARWNLSGNFADVQSDYDVASSTYDNYYGRYLGGVTDVFAREIPLGGGERVLELAAGTGRLTVAVRQRLQQHGAHVTAVDLSSGMLAFNRTKNSSVDGATVDFLHADAIDAIKKQPDESLDAVLCAWGICYLPHATLRAEVERVLKPGGLLAVIENRKCTLKEIGDLFEQVIVQHPSYLRKAIKINLPEDAAYLVKRLCGGRLKELNRRDGVLDIPYDSPSEVREYMLKSGASAGFLDAIDPRARDEFLQAFEELIALQRRPVPLTHRYSVLMARKA